MTDALGEGCKTNKGRHLLLQSLSLQRTMRFLYIRSKNEKRRNIMPRPGAVPGRVF